MMRLEYDKITQPHIIDAFYLADRQDEHMVDDVISAWTGLFPCNWGTIATSHEERGVFVDGKLWFFSSTIRIDSYLQGISGTRWIMADKMLHNAERWALRVSRQLTDKEISLEIDRANSLLGRRYDLLGVVLDFVRPCIIGNQRKKIYCSKACHYMHTGKFARISPRRRSKYAKKHGYTPISVTEALEMQ